MYKPGIFIDNFCGGGGASTGIGAALGRPVDVAVNHDPVAIAVHSANHITAEHHCNDIRAVWPRLATRGRRVAGIWFSPDCKEFSKAKGGPVKDRSIRTLAMEIPHWLEETDPEVAYVENVEEFEDWGPLEQGEDGRWRIMADHKGKDFQKWVRLCRRTGRRVEWRRLRACDYGAPTSRLRLYIVMKKIVMADGTKGKITWPKPTHGKPDSAGVRSGRLQPYRTAAECIDWSISVPSIFDRAKSHAEATNRRVAHGVMKYVVNAARPFIVPITHTQASPRAHDSAEPLRTITTANGGEFMAVDATLAAPHITKFHSTGIGSPINVAMPTVTSNGTSPRAGAAVPLGLVGCTMVQTGHGERPGQMPRAINAQNPLGTVVATAENFAAVRAEMQAVHLDRQFGNSLGAAADEPAPTTLAGGGGKTAQVSAFLSRFHKSNTNGGRGAAADPLGAVTAGGQHHAVVCAHMEQANTGGMIGRAADKPVTTITTSGAQQQLVQTTLLPEDALPPAMMARANLVAAFLVKYYGAAKHGQAVDQPFDTVTTLPGFAVVTVEIDSVTYVIVDIGLRMLTPRELARAQGFPDSYVIDPVCWYTTPKGQRKFGRIPKALQIRMIGNSVCPDVARALVAANQPGVNDNWSGTVSSWAMAA